MHELTIATSLIDLACKHAAARGGARVSRISVRLGVLSGLVRPLYFCFQAAARGTLCEGAILDIEEVPLSVHCPRCNEVKSPASLYSFRCPDCGTPTPDVKSGRETQLVSIFLDEEELRGAARAVSHLGVPACSTSQPARHNNE